MFKRNTAVTGFGIGHFIQTADGAAKTTGTPTCKRTLDGVGDACANAASYNADGAVWEIDLDATDMDAAVVILSFALTDCIPISYTIKTVTKLVSELNDLGGTAQTGDAYAVVAHTDYGNAKLVRSTTPTNTLAVDASGRVDLVDAPNATAVTAIQAGLATTGADGDTLETLSDQLDALPADTWSYTTRTLTQSSTSTTDSTAAGSIARRRGDSWSISLTIGAITGYTSLWFTVKHSQDDADSDAILQIKLNSSGSDDDLLYVNGATASDSTLGAITVSDASTGAIIIAVDETVTDDMPAGAFYYDVQVLNSGAVTTPDSGKFTITADVTRSVT